MDARVGQIKNEIEASDSDWDREKLQERLAKLAGGIGVVKVGAHTEVELKERKHRLEDAISATRAAVEEGIVPGGGAALVHAAKVLEGGLGLEGDELTGLRVVQAALDEPARWIAENAGLEGRVAVNRTRESGNEPDRPQRRDRRVRQPGRGRRRRPGQGHPLRRPQRRLDRQHAADHRDAGRRPARRGRGRCRPQPRRPRPRPLARPGTTERAPLGRGAPFPLAAELSEAHRARARPRSDNSRLRRGRGKEVSAFEGGHFRRTGDLALEGWTSRGRRACSPRGSGCGCRSTGCAATSWQAGRGST